MAWIRTDALRPGAVLSRPLVDPAGRVVVPAGVPLGEAEVARVRQGALEGVEVVEAGAVTAVVAEVRRAFRNNDAEHPAIARLTGLMLRRRLGRATRGAC